MYPLFAVLTSVISIVLLAFVVVRLFRGGYPQPARPVMRMLAYVLFASLLLGLVGGLRLAFEPQDPVERVLSILLVALRVFIVGASVSLAWDMRRGA